MDPLKEVINSRGKGNVLTTLVIVAIAVVFVYFLISHVFVVNFALGFDLSENNVGYGIAGAKETTISDGWPSRRYNYDYVKLYGTYKHPLSTNWYLDVEPAIGYHRAWGDGEDRTGVSIEINGWFCYDFVKFTRTNKLYFGAGVGALTMIPSSKQPEMGNSGAYGLFGGRLGYKHKVSDIIVDVSVGLEHFSDALQNHDAGRNFTTLKISFTPFK